MLHLTLSLGKATFADHLVGRGLAIDAVLMASGVALTSIAAQVSVPVLTSSFTAQAAAVLVVGMALGLLRGVLAVLLYIALGALGLPIFNDGTSGVESIVDTSGGYLPGLLGAAAVVGWFAQRALDQTLLRSFLSATAAVTVLCLIAAVQISAIGLLDGAQNQADATILAVLCCAGFSVVFATAVNSTSWAAIRRMHQRDDEQYQSQQGELVR